MSEMRIPLCGGLYLGDACDFHDAPFAIWRKWDWLWQYPPCCLSADHLPLCPSLKAPIYLRGQYGRWGLTVSICRYSLWCLSSRSPTSAQILPPIVLVQYGRYGPAWRWLCPPWCLSSRSLIPAPSPQPTCAIWRIWAWQWLCPPWCLSSRSPIPAPSPNLPVQYGGYGPGSGCVHRGVSPADQQLCCLGSDVLTVYHSRFMINHSVF
jgi:hypothetical protein